MSKYDKLTKVLKRFDTVTKELAKNTQFENILRKTKTTITIFKK